MYYYAMLNRKDVVTAVYALLSPLPESRYIVEISKAWYEDKRLVGMKYDRASHSFMFWACSTDNVQYLNTSESLSEKLESMDSAISEAKVDISSLNSDMASAITQIAETAAVADNASAGVDRLDTDLAILANQVGGVEDSVGSVSHRVGQLEADYTETKAKTEEALKDVDTDIKALKADTAANAGEIRKANTRIAEIDDVNTQQNAEITRIDQNVETVIYTVNDHESAINGLEEKLDSSVEDINKNFQQVNANFDVVREDIAELAERQGRTDNSINTIWADIRIKEVEMADFKAETAENFAEAQEAVNSLDGRVTANAGDIAALIGSMNKAETSIKNLVTNVNSVAADVDNVEKAVDTAEANISAIQNVNTQQNSKISALETKVSTVTTQANTNKTEIASVKSSVSTANTNITNLTKRVTTAESNIKTLQSDVATAKTNITNVTNKANTNASNITAVTNRVTTAEKNISTANSNISKLTTRVTTAENAIDAVEADVATIAANKVLQFTNANGQPKYMFKEGEDLLQGLMDLPVGATTAYANNKAIGVPKSNEQWRMMIHKTNAEILWVIAFGSVGSIYTNYYNTETYGWQGWKCIYNALPEALWKGGQYPNASANIVPSKKLSECRTGWILMWSDYDVSTKAINDYDFCTSVIYKCKPDGSKWNGESFNFSIPNYVASDPASDTRIMKKLKIYDNKIVGYDENSTGTRNDVVLRAVMEF